MNQGRRNVIPTVCVNTYNGGNCETLLNQLSQHLEPTQIIVVKGGMSVTSVAMTSTHCQVFVEHNSIDFTSHVAIVENRKKIEGCIKRRLESFLYLHDSCTVEPTFFSWLRMHYSDQTAKLLRPSIFLDKCFNVGIYNLDDLTSIQRYISLLKCTPTSTIEQNACKGMGFALEDGIFHCLGTTRVLETKWMFKGFKGERAKLYFPTVGLTKYQSCGLFCPWMWRRCQKHIVLARMGMCPLE